MRIDVTQNGSIGWLPDLPHHELPMAAFTDCENVRFTDGAAERVRGYFEGYGQPLGFARKILQVRDADGDYYWAYAYDDGVAMSKGELHGSIGKGGTTYALAEGEKPSLFRFNDRLIVNYPGIAPQYMWPISNAGTLADLPYFPANTTVTRMVAFREFLVGLGVTTASGAEHSTVLWSTAADAGQLPDSWDISDPAKDAGAFQLGEDGDRIVDAAVLGDKLIIYKENSIWAMEYVGYPAIFSFRRLFSGVGLLTADAVMAFDDKHVFIGRGDVFVHDGQSMKSLLANGWQRWFRQAIDKERGWKAYIQQYAYQNEMWIVFPSDGSEECNTVLVWNYLNDTKALRSFPKLTALGIGYLDIADNITWDDFQGLWFAQTEEWDETAANWNGIANPEDWSEFASSWDTIIGNRNVNHMLMGVSTQDGSDARFAFTDSTGRFGNHNFRAELERRNITYGSVDRQGRPLANLHEMKCLREVWVRAETDGPLFVQVGTQEDVDMPVTWEPPMVFDPRYHKKVDCFVSGKVLAIRFFSLEKGYWRLQGYELTIEKMGVY